VLSEEAKARIAKLRADLPDSRSALLAALYEAQRAYGGWLPDRVLDEVAALMEMPAALVASVTSFYTMFHRQPVGRHLIQVCTNVSCSLLGAQRILEYLSQKLGIGVGETTPDGQFTLLEVECLGACGAAPAIQVDDAYYENVTEETIDQLLEELAGEQVAGPGQRSTGAER
jgi:NADH-quinone oxidoreductase subunit E